MENGKRDGRVHHREPNGPPLPMDVSILSQYPPDAPTALRLYMLGEMRFLAEQEDEEDEEDEDEDEEVEVEVEEGEVEEEDATTVHLRAQVRAGQVLCGQDRQCGPAPLGAQRGSRRGVDAAIRPSGRCEVL